MRLTNDVRSCVTRAKARIMRVGVLCASPKKPIKTGAARENWTPDLIITNDALYHWATAAFQWLSFSLVEIYHLYVTKSICLSFDSLDGQVTLILIPVARHYIPSSEAMMTKRFGKYAILRIMKHLKIVVFVPQFPMSALPLELK